MSENEVKENKEILEEASAEEKKQKAENKEKNTEPKVIRAREEEPGYLKRKFTATYSATGRRKQAVARIIVTPGKGVITINKKPAQDYLPTENMIQLINQPFEITKLPARFDVNVSVKGGGFAGQSGAIRHGISRALGLMDEEIRKRLKVAGLLTRDARVKERKKYGQRGARARFQFSKR